MIHNPTFYQIYASLHSKSIKFFQVNTFIYLNIWTRDDHNTTALYAGVRSSAHKARFVDNWIFYFNLYTFNMTKDIIWLFGFCQKKKKKAFENHKI